MNKYDSLTNLLKTQPGIFLEIRRLDGQYGINNIRNISINEPNPNEGYVHDEGSDQSYSEGPIRERRGFSFRARDTNEGLNLLERACLGEKDLQNTVGKGLWSDNKKDHVHGYETPQGGFDNWIYAHFSLKIEKELDNLIAKILIVNWPDTHVIGKSRIVENVDEAINLYENTPVDISTLVTLRKGFVIHNRFEQKNGLIKPEQSLSEGHRDTLDFEFLEKYYNSLEKLKSFDLSKKEKDGLFIGMLLNNFYKLIEQ